MKKIFLTASLILGTTTMLCAQSAIDALNVAQPQFRGTARFMGMGGAFTALGGDLSTLTQNPAGIGIYRHSEIGATLDVNIGRTTVTGQDGGPSRSNDKTKASCPNFGYVGVTKLDGALKAFQWGATYSRMAEIDRVASGYVPQAQTSLSNYIASFSKGYTESELNFGDNYNPYIDGNAHWLSILAYNTYMINPRQGSENEYNGLYNDNTVCDADLTVRERAYIDEYSFNFGGDISNTLYWGVGIGVTDMSYTREAWYSESMKNASVMSPAAGGRIIQNGDAGINLDNWKRISGTGWKISFGLIYKPINEVRIGAAIQSPTYWSLDQSGQGILGYSYYDPDMKGASGNPLKGEENTEWADFNWRLKSPWRIMIGAAAVLGGQGIISLDYERQAYNDMTVSNQVYDRYGYGDGYMANEPVNGDIRNYLQAANILRLGAEYRVTPQFSIRAGYNLQTSTAQNKAKDGMIEILTSGTDPDPSYSFDKNIQHISLGLGFRVSAWYLDAAYVYGVQKSTLHAYTNFNGKVAPQYEVTNHTNQIVLSTGFKF